LLLLLARCFITFSSYASLYIIFGTND